MRIFRPHRGTFDGWRFYSVVIDDAERHHIADTQVLDVEGDSHEITVAGGGFTSGPVCLTTKSDEVVLCELAANPQQGDPPVRLTVISEAEAQQRVLRFDKPPYVGGKWKGLATAISGIGVSFGFAIVTAGLFIAALSKLAHPASIGAFLFVSGSGIFLCLGAAFVGATGVRSLFYYFRLPRDWRH